MPDENHKIQNDPSEGSRKVIEHELERATEGKGNGAGHTPAGKGESGNPGEAGSGKRPG